MRKPKTPPLRQIYDGLNMGWIPVWSRGAEVSTPPGMPSEVSILGQKYRVRYRSEIHHVDKKRKIPVDGIVIFSHRLILIDPTQGVHSMKETLWHEMCHVYFNEAQKKDLRLAKVTDAQIEGICDLFGEAVYDLVANNPLPRA
jgi:hypothetical protein